MLDRRVAALLFTRGEDRLVVYLVDQDPAPVMTSLEKAGWTPGEQVWTFPQPWPDVAQRVVYVGQHPNAQDLRR